MATCNNGSKNKMSQQQQQQYQHSFHTATTEACPCKRIPLSWSTYTAAEFGILSLIVAKTEQQQQRQQQQEYSTSTNGSTTSSRSNNSAIDRHVSSTAITTTPIHLAAQHGHVETLQYLLQQHEQTMVQKHVHSILLRLVQAKREQERQHRINNEHANNEQELNLLYKMLMLLNCTLSNPVSNTNNTYVTATRDSCNIIIPIGYIPLHRSCYSGSIDTTKLLIEYYKRHNLLVDAILWKDTSFHDKQTPLHKAASGGRYRIIQLLLHHTIIDVNDSMDCNSSNNSASSTKINEWEQSIMIQQQQHKNTNHKNNCKMKNSRKKTVASILHQLALQQHHEQEVNKQQEQTGQQYQYCRLQYYYYYYVLVYLLRNYDSQYKTPFHVSYECALSNNKDSVARWDSISNNTFPDWYQCMKLLYEAELYVVMTLAQLLLPLVRGNNNTDNNNNNQSCNEFSKSPLLLSPLPPSNELLMSETITTTERNHFQNEHQWFQHDDTNKNSSFTISRSNTMYRNNTENSTETVFLQFFRVCPGWILFCQECSCSNNTTTTTTSTTTIATFTTAPTKNDDEVVMCSSNSSNNNDNNIETTLLSQNNHNFEDELQKQKLGRLCYFCNCKSIVLYPILVQVQSVGGHDVPNKAIYQYGCKSCKTKKKKKKTDKIVP